MSNAVKISVGIIIIVLVVAGMWWYKLSKTDSYTPVPANTQVQATPVEEFKPASVLATSESDTTDGALATDLKSIDDLADGFSSDSKSMETSVANY